MISLSRLCLGFRFTITCFTCMRNLYHTSYGVFLALLKLLHCVLGKEGRLSTSAQNTCDFGGTGLTQPQICFFIFHYSMVIQLLFWPQLSIKLIVDFTVSAAFLTVYV